MGLVTTKVDIKLNQIAATYMQIKGMDGLDILSVKDEIDTFQRVVVTYAYDE